MSIIALNNDTLAVTPVAGQIEYNGQFYGTDSNASRAQMQRLVQGTSQASTSGTSIDFTGLPAWVKRITVMFSGVSTSGTSIHQVQIGSGSVTTSGYTGASSQLGVSATALTTLTSGVPIYSNIATYSLYGSMTITNISGNIWVFNGCFANLITTSLQFLSSGGVSLSGTLDRVRITTVNGTDTFDAGSINILYEG
jgi:hypothetical protein